MRALLGDRVLPLEVALVLARMLLLALDALALFLLGQALLLPLAIALHLVAPREIATLRIAVLRFPARVGCKAHRLLARRHALRRALPVTRLGLARDGGAAGSLFLPLVPGLARLLLAPVGKLAGLLRLLALLGLAGPGLLVLTTRLRLALLGGLLLAPLRLGLFGLALLGLALLGLAGERLARPGLLVCPLDRFPARGLLRRRLPLRSLPLRSLLARGSVPAAIFRGFLGALVALVRTVLLAAVAATVVVACHGGCGEADRQHRGDHGRQDRAWGGIGAGHRVALVACSRITADVQYA